MKMHVQKRILANNVPPCAEAHFETTTRQIMLQPCLEMAHNLLILPLFAAPTT